MYGNMPTGPLRKVVRQNTRAYSIDRRVERDETTAGSGENYTEDTTIADLYIYGESGGDSVIDVGEVETGGAQGVALAEAPLQEGDRLDYGDTRYEVSAPIREVPKRGDTKVVSFNLERVDNTTANTRL